ncbi:MAG: hypothetical protein ACE37F_11180 [Nannocystaceae bacterium]|nr:C13 family peptidase [bacterium]
MRRLLFAAFFGTAACRPEGASTTPDPFAAQPYDTAPPSPRAKVFLVAGGDDIANFAAEVLEQRTLWRRAGLREDEIACYFAKPTTQALREDAEQYAALALALRSCRAATPERLFTDLRAAARDAEGFVYLFVTSHGLASQLRPLETSQNPRTQRFVASLGPDERDALEPAAVGLDAGAGPRLGDSRAVVAALREGRSAEQTIVSPRTLAPVLEAFPPEVEKIVVLQACFSGGFIDHHARRRADPSPGADALLAVPNLTVLTATAAERPSFGCGSGAARTYFGGAFNVALERALAEHPPRALPWEDIHHRVSFAIEAMEAVAGQRASHPGFVSPRMARPRP